MKLGSLKSNGASGSRDGQLVVVSRCNQWAVAGTDVPSLRVSTLREAIENWSTHEKKLKNTFDKLNTWVDKKSNETDELAEPFRVNESDFHSPLPRSFQWADGSAFIHHIILVRKARGAQPPETLTTVPLMYQGGGDDFLAPYEDIPQVDFSHGTDFEGELGVVVDDVPMGVLPDKALSYIRLFVLINDVSLRGLIPGELKQGFGFFQSKPSTSFAPFAITPDELGEAWREGRVHLPLQVQYNGKFFGCAEAGAMHFHFGQLIAHAARTRRLRAGTVVGSGTVSNDDPSKGSSCLAEKRMIEKINTGSIATSFMRVGDTVKMQMLGPKGGCLFGCIQQKVVAAC